MFNFYDLIIIFSLTMARNLARFSDAFHNQTKPICTQYRLFKRDFRKAGSNCVS